MLTSRHLLLLLILCSAGSAQTLRELANERGITFGAAVEPAYFNEVPFAATLTREFNMVEAENAMKFGPIHPGVSAYNFAPSDAIRNFAQTNEMEMRGHVLVWHNQNAPWVEGITDPAQLSAALRDHIRAVVGRYAGQIYAWDVVNEAFNDGTAGTLRNSLWYNQPGIGLTGTGYIEQAFRWANEADPNALLFYNDYSAEHVNAKSDAVYRMAQDFVARGVPMHGIGFQVHFEHTTGNIASVEANIKRLTDLGLQVHITELDVRIPVDSAGNATAADLAAQAQVYRQVVAACLKFPLCTSIQTWGVGDRHSWIPGFFPGRGAALLFDTNYAPKPAYAAVKEAFQTVPPTIRAAGVANAASYQADAVAPGEILVIFGPTYGPAALTGVQLDSNGRVPTEWANTRVFFNGVPAPIVYSKVGQVSVIVPFSVATSRTVQIEYQYKGLRSAPITMDVVPTKPGLFTLDASGLGQGAILDSSYRLNSQANPARKGDVVLLFATGGGVMNPALSDGQVVSSLPLPVPVARTTARIGGVDCPVHFIGGAPGLVAGALQLNVQIADGVPSGQQPVEITIGEAKSQRSVTLWVQ